MPKPTSIARVVCLLLCASVTSFAQTQQPRPDASPRAAQAALPSDLADFFPADTSMYFEVRDYASALERQAGSFEAFYKGIETFVGAQTGGDAKLPLTADELRALLSSDIAYGLRSLTSASPRPGLMLVVRTRSADAAAMVRDRVLPLLIQPLRGAAPQKQTIGDQTITVVPLNGGSADSISLAYAVAQETIVFGDLQSVRALFEPSAGATKLSTAPAFAEARRRLSSDTDLFLWTDLFSSTAPMLFGLSSRQRDDNAAVVGIESIRGIAIAGRSSGDTARNELLVQVDRSKENLVTLLTSPPAIELRAAALLPARTHAVASFGFDAARAFDYLSAHPPQKDAVRHDILDAGTWSRTFESRFGMKLREEFIAALGDEITFAWDYGPVIAALETSKPASPTMLVLVEVTKPEVARRVLVRAMARHGAVVAERERDGVTIAEAGNTACAVVDGIAVIGPTAGVERALDAHKSGETLASSPEFEGLRTRISGDTVAGFFVSPELGRLAVELVKRSDLLKGSESQILGIRPVPLTATLTKEDLGVYASIEVTTASGLSMFGAMAPVLLPSLGASRRAANESAAIGTLRMLASAEALFRSKNDRYGTFQELVEAKMLDETYVDGLVRNGYRYRMVSATDKTFEMSAEPVGETSGSTSYNVTEDFLIRSAPGATAPKGTSGKVLGAE